MSRSGPSSPKPWKQREARTTYLRVPVDDWLKVKQGRKTEFRATGRGHVTQLWNVEPPVLVIGWAQRHGGEYDKIPLVLEATWQEPLGAISEESLAREGFPSLAHFRRYWMERTKQRFKVMQMVQVYRVHLFEPHEAANLGLQLLHRLYGEHLHGVA